MEVFNVITQAFSQIYDNFDESELKKFINCNYNDLSEYHFGLGMWIRNNLLFEDSYLYQFFVYCGISQKDDMSCLITELFYISLKYRFGDK